MVGDLHFDNSRDPVSSSSPSISTAARAFAHHWSNLVNGGAEPLSSIRKLADFEAYQVLREDLLALANWAEQRSEREFFPLSYEMLSTLDPLYGACLLTIFRFGLPTTESEREAFKAATRLLPAVCEDPEQMFEESTLRSEVDHSRRFSRLLGVPLALGIPMMPAFQLVADRFEGQVKEAILHARESIRNGHVGFDAPLSNPHLFDVFDSSFLDQCRRATWSGFLAEGLLRYAGLAGEAPISVDDDSPANAHEGLPEGRPNSITEAVSLILPTLPSSIREDLVKFPAAYLHFSLGLAIRNRYLRDDTDGSNPLLEDCRRLYVEQRSEDPSWKELLDLGLKRLNDKGRASAGDIGRFLASGFVDADAASSMIIDALAETVRSEKGDG